LKRAHATTFEVLNGSEGGGGDRVSHLPPVRAAASTLWSLLCEEIGLAPEQADALRTQLRSIMGSPDVPRETWRLGMAAGYLQKLRGAVTMRAAAAQEHLDALRAALTPGQIIRYLAWLERNRHSVGIASACDAAAALAVEAHGGPPALNVVIVVIVAPIRGTVIVRKHGLQKWLN
jgi:hypothetical protein